MAESTPNITPDLGGHVMLDAAALSPLDGRYRYLLDDLFCHFSESAFLRQRVHVEVE
jgi:hypothetical protein